MRTKNKRSSLPKLGAGQKQTSLTICVLKASAHLTKGVGHAAILHTILCNSYYPGNPKGGPWPNGPSKYAPAPKILVITTEFVSKNCFFADFFYGFTPEFVKFAYFFEMRSFFFVFTLEFVKIHAYFEMKIFFWSLLQIFWNFEMKTFVFWSTLSDSKY